MLLHQAAHRALTSCVNSAHIQGKPSRILPLSNGRQDIILSVLGVGKGSGGWWGGGQAGKYKKIRTEVAIKCYKSRKYLERMVKLLQNQSLAKEKDQLPEMSQATTITSMPG